jgi:carbamoyl-phosphate synthase small subunit
LCKPAILALEDGTVFHGESIGAAGIAVGEVVFNTSITGYQEILTDPSYCRQIITLTYPHIGNVGTNSEDRESLHVHASGLVVRHYPSLHSSWRAAESLQEFLLKQGVAAISEIDTRHLTRILREQGAQAGCIQAGEDLDTDRAVERAREFPGLKGMDLAQVVSSERPYEWTQGSWTLTEGLPEPLPADMLSRHVVAYDFGIKHNILRMLVDRGCRVTVVPAMTPAQEVLGLRPDGVFLSNGPGDPEPCAYAIDAIKEIVRQRVPTFGICLGHQLLALASGARTVKMKFGHHGANHPVSCLDTGRVMITSQNHGFAVDESSLPTDMRATHRSLFDGSLQGVHRLDYPAFGFQGHPEASPGPRDVAALFDHFVSLMDVA